MRFLTFEILKFCILPIRIVCLVLSKNSGHTFPTFFAWHVAWNNSNSLFASCCLHFPWGPVVILIHCLLYVVVYISPGGLAFELASQIIPSYISSPVYVVVYISPGGPGPWISKSYNPIIHIISCLLFIVCFMLLFIFPPGGLALGLASQIIPSYIISPVYCLLFALCCCLYFPRGAWPLD